MQSTKPFAGGEFIKECMMKVVDKITPEKKQEFANVCLARNTVVRRIEDVSSDIRRQLQAKGAEFDFFRDESTNASDTSQFPIFMRGVNNDMSVSEELLALQSLKEQKRGTDLFGCVRSAGDDMKLTWNSHWDYYMRRTCHDWRAQWISNASLQQSRRRGGKAIKLHCIIHQRVLCAKYLKCDHVMKTVIKSINPIRSKAVTASLKFLLDIHAEYGDAVYHNDVRWLSEDCTAALLLSQKRNWTILGRKGTSDARTI